MKHICSTLISLFVLTKCDREHESHGATSEKLRFKRGESNIFQSHEAGLASTKAAGDFDTLSRSKSEHRLGTIAWKMDINSDGFIDENELFAWIRNSMRTVDLEGTRERFIEIDIDKDGMVTWDEYVRDAYGDPSEEFDPEDVKLMHEDEDYFEGADQNSDGNLSAEEFDSFNNPENHASMYDTLIRITVNEKDTNKDGKIDLFELLGDAGDSLHSEWSSAEKERFENEYDLDHNGFLEGEELGKWLIPDLDATARQETKHLISGADKDNDRRLTVEEILVAHELFTGSEATNFGQALYDVDHDEL